MSRKRQEVAKQGSAVHNNVCNFSDILKALEDNVKFIEQVENKLKAAQRLVKKGLEPKDESKLLSIELNRRIGGEDVIAQASLYVGGCNVPKNRELLSNVKVVRETGDDALPIYRIHSASGAQTQAVGDAVSNVCKLHDQLLSVVKDIGDIKNLSKYEKEFTNESSGAKSSEKMSFIEMLKYDNDVDCLKEKTLPPAVRSVHFFSLPEGELSRSFASTSAAASQSLNPAIRSVASSSSASSATTNEDVKNISQQLEGKGMTERLGVIKDVANLAVIKRLKVEQFDKILKEFFTGKDGKSAFVTSQAVIHYINSSENLVRLCGGEISETAKVENTVEDTLKKISLDKAPTPSPAAVGSSKVSSSKVTIRTT